MKNIKHLFNHIKEIMALFFNGFAKHDLMTQSAALAFYTVLSLAPLLLFMIIATRLLHSGVEYRLIEQVSETIGVDAGKAIENIIVSVRYKEELKNSAGILGIVTLLFSSSGVFSQLHSSLNMIWEFKTEEKIAGWITYLRKKIFSMGTVIVFAFLELLSLTVNTIIGFIFPTVGEVWKLLNELITIVIFTALFVFIFKYFSNKKLPFKYLIFGAFFTSILFAIGKILIGIYIVKSAVGSAYGAAGSLMILLVWIYYSSLIIFMGAEFMNALFKINSGEKTE